MAAYSIAFCTIISQSSFTFHSLSTLLNRAKTDLACRVLDLAGNFQHYTSQVAMSRGMLKLCKVGRNIVPESEREAS